MHIASTGSAISLPVLQAMSSPDILAAIDQLVPDFHRQGYLMSYIDSANARHYILTNAQFEEFKAHMDEARKLLLVPTVLRASETCGEYGVPVDETMANLHDNWFDAIIIGSGLAGLCAAITLAKSNPKLKIVVLEGEASLGGNSNKASSGISGICTPTQIAAGIKDSPEKFLADTLKSGQGHCDPKLVSALAKDAPLVWDFLTKECGIDLSKVTQCGGHSVARTHRPQGSANVGYIFVSTLLGMIDKYYKSSVRIYKQCKCQALLCTNRVINGVVVQYKNVMLRCRGSSVFITTGGFANDHTSDSLLKEFVPQFEGFPTTNGPFAQGSGIKMARKAGAAVVDMSYVQRHPTGFVDPANRDCKTKFLAPELLRGVGSILLNRRGKRFADELGLRDYLTEQIIKFCAPDSVAVMLFNQKSAGLFSQYLDFYSKKGLIKKFEGLKSFCEGYGVSYDELVVTLHDYKEAAMGQRPDPFGKRIFPSIIEPDEAVYYGCEVTPSLHYTMGGLQIDVDANVQTRDATGKLVGIAGLYAMGEVAGGVHGANRLVGNSLLGCVVFGRRAGVAAEKYLTMMSKL